MIINIHGFGGKGNNSKYNWLKENYPEENIYYKTFNYSKDNPEFILEHYINKINKAIKNSDSIKIVATSWGGFFGYCLSCIFDYIPTILINPSLNPHLSKRIVNKKIDKNILRSYMGIFSKYIFNHRSNCVAICGVNDTVINHDILTYPIFSSNSIYKFNIEHNFDIFKEKDIGNIIRNHFNKNFNFEERDFI